MNENQVRDELVAMIRADQALLADAGGGPPKPLTPTQRESLLKTILNLNERIAAKSTLTESDAKRWEGLSDDELEQELRTTLAALDWVGHSDSCSPT